MEEEKKLQSQREQARWGENGAIHPGPQRRTQSEFTITHSNANSTLSHSTFVSLCYSYQVAGTHPEYHNSMTDGNLQYMTLTPTHPSPLHSPVDCGFPHAIGFRAINLIRATSRKTKFVTYVQRLKGISMINNKHMHAQTCTNTVSMPRETSWSFVRMLPSPFAGTTEFP